VWCDAPKRQVTARHVDEATRLLRTSIVRVDDKTFDLEPEEAADASKKDKKEDKEDKKEQKKKKKDDDDSEDEDGDEPKPAAGKKAGAGAGAGAASTEQKKADSKQPGSQVFFRVLTYFLFQTLFC
jgi:hypothetical protein